jgi:hypothetical protein
VSKKINRHLRAENARLRAEVRRLAEKLNAVRIDRESLEQTVADMEEARAIEEGRCERTKLALRADAARERRAREDLEHDQWRAEQRARGRL